MRRLLLALLLAAIPAAAGAEAIQVLMAGRSPRSIDAYRIGSAFYLDSGSAGSLFRAQTHWRPMSGTVLMSLRGQRVQFAVDSREASVGGRPVTLLHPVIVRVGQAFIPVEFFASEEFEGLSGYEARFHPESKVLTIERKVTVGPLQWFSHGDRSQVALGLKPGLAFTVTRRGRSGVQVQVPFGRADSAAQVAVEDGLVKTVRLDQQPESDPKLVRLVVELAHGVELWEQTVEESPRRVVLNVFKNAAARDRFHSAPPPAVAPAPKAPVVEKPIAAPKVEVVETPVAAATPPPPVTMHKPRIVIDAGHGGKDKGATGVHKTYEKDINLKVAQDLAKRLKDSGHFEVLLTRDDDTFVKLSERSKAANDFRADLFISLHCNSTSHRGERGFEIYFLSEKASDPESQRVADVENAVLELEGKPGEQESAAMLLQAMAKTEFMNDGSELAGLMVKELPRRVDLKDRGVKQASFYVLRGTNAPAVLVEMGFLSNVGDEARLTNRKFRRSLVEGLYAGILDFAKRHKWELNR